MAMLVITRGYGDGPKPVTDDLRVSGVGGFWLIPVDVIIYIYIYYVGSTDLRLRKEREMPNSSSKLDDHTRNRSWIILGKLVLQVSGRLLKGFPGPLMAFTSARMKTFWHGLPANRMHIPQQGGLGKARKSQPMRPYCTIHQSAKQTKEFNSPQFLPSLMMTSARDVPIYCICRLQWPRLQAQFWYNQLRCGGSWNRVTSWYL